ncbi:MAG: hypothetical protein K0U98_06160 [Deltaproteobacteria bacterium]|nr:hypothetical protein [Deltaproteobacteria bacterium]
MTAKTMEGLWAWLCDNGVATCPECGTKKMQYFVAGVHDGSPVVSLVCRRGHESFTPDLDEETESYGFTLASVEAPGPPAEVQP